MGLRPLRVVLIACLFLELPCCSRRCIGVRPPAETPKPALRLDSFYVEWLSFEPISSLTPGKPATLLVSLRNKGRALWPDPQEAQPGNPTGRNAVRLSARWVDPRTRRIERGFEGRSDLPWPVSPGAVIRLPLFVIVPERPGRHDLEIDLVQEGVAWFASRGGGRLVVPVEIAEP